VFCTPLCPHSGPMLRERNTCLTLHFLDALRSRNVPDYGPRIRHTCWRVRLKNRLSRFGPFPASSCWPNPLVCSKNGQLAPENSPRQRKAGIRYRRNVHVESRGARQG
jgi:hypothetical protein